jgi:hypothetical protein
VSAWFDRPICGLPDPGSAWLPGGGSIIRHDLIGFCSNYHGTAHQDGTGLVLDQRGKDRA